METHGILGMLPSAVYSFHISGIVYEQQWMPTNFKDSCRERERERERECSTFPMPGGTFLVYLPPSLCTQGEAH